MELLTPQEVADELRISVFAVYDWLRRERIKGIKLPGGSWRVERSEVDRILMQGERGGE